MTLALEQHLSSGTPLARHCGYGSKSVAACPTRQSCFVRKDKNTSFTVASGVVVVGSCGGGAGVGEGGGKVFMVRGYGVGRSTILYPEFGDLSLRAIAVT